MKIFLLSLLLTTNALFALEPPKKQGDLKAYYLDIHERAQKLKKVPDDKLLGALLSDCVKAKTLDPNIFCLESLVEFYGYFPHTVSRVAKDQLSKEDAELVIKRLDILKAEAVEGHDPEAAP